MDHRLSFLSDFGRWIGRYALIVAALSATQPDSRAQSPELTSVKAWRGWFRTTGHQNEHDLPDFITRIGETHENYQASFSAEVYLDDYDTHPSTWTGRTVSSMLISNYDAVIKTSSVTLESNFSAAGPVPQEPGDHGPRLVFHGDGWELHFDANRIPAAITKKTIFKSNGQTFTDTSKSPVYVPHHNADSFPYPAKGLILRGHAKYTLNEITSSPLPVVTYPVEFDVDIYLEPAGLQELQLEIDPGAAYETWLPDTTGGAAAGTALPITAKLVAVDGSKPQADVVSVTWKLVDTSREPGVAMNFPLNASDKEYDLKLEAEGKFFRLSDDKQQVERAVESGNYSDTVTVRPFDWGAWSTLQVTAKLSDGREIIGKMKDAKEPDLRLPKRSPTSFIADYWKQQNGVLGVADRSDDDDTPDGDGTKGDGFTLYEEYRGFYVNTDHITTNPKKKDLFVRLQNAGYAAPGVELFGALTQIDVHHRLASNEFLPSRVMNANHDGGPHLVDQHGLLVTVKAGQDGYAAAQGGPGNPKRITSIDLPGSWGGAPIIYISASIAHELGHAVNLYHHGDSDIEDATWAVRGTELFENGQAIRVVDEAGVDLTTRVINVISQKPGQERPIYIGSDQGQHSGVDTCIMRYDVAKTYRNRNRPLFRVTNYQEIAGGSLCRSSAGSGVNDANHQPATRYGNAAPNRGDCSHQILVTDAIEAPSHL